MKKRSNILWITETAVMLALLVSLQAITKPVGQLLTGSCVNSVLAVTVLLCGFGSGLTVALISPVCAYLFNIAPQILVVPAIMVGNCAFVLVFKLLMDKALWKQILSWLLAACAKFAVMYVLVVYVICGVASTALMNQGLMVEKMITALPLQFGVMQLFTALIGGGVALLIVPILKKALHRN